MEAFNRSGEKATEVDETNPITLLKTPGNK